VRGLQEQLEWETSRRDELVNEAVGPVEREMTLALETVDQAVAHRPVFTLFPPYFRPVLTLFSHCFNG